jgi:uncharacterized protein
MRRFSTLTVRAACSPRTMTCLARGLFGETALHFLAVEGYSDAVRFLAEAGADVNATNEDGDVPLIEVATLGNHQVAEILLAHGANPNATSRLRDNVLHTAVGSDNAQLVHLLLSRGANPYYRTELGETVFDALPADPERRRDIVRVLSEHGVTASAAE